MEQRKHEMGLLDLMDRPAFCVAEGKITQVNAAAAAFGLAPQMELAPLLANGSEEYTTFESGCLYLSLVLEGIRMGASVTRMDDMDVFRLEELDDNQELRTMALAAMHLRAPLSTVMVTAQRLFPVSGLEDEPAIREHVAQINRGLYQMLRVLDNMSDAVSVVGVGQLQSGYLELIERAMADTKELMGATETVNFKDHKGIEALTGAVKDAFGGYLADFAFQCTGSPVAHANIYKFIRNGGGLCELGFFINGGDATINPHFDICAKEITTVGSWVYTLRDYATTFDFLKRAKAIGLPMEKLITHKYPLEEINEALQTNLKMEGLKIAIVNK